MVRSPRRPSSLPLIVLTHAGVRELVRQAARRPNVWIGSVVCPGNEVFGQG